MMENDDPKDWEYREEEPPPALKEKWAKDEILGPETIECPACKHRVPIESLTCLYCGEQVFREAGFLSGLLRWFKNLFDR